jgi:hypothetical protein
LTAVMGRHDFFWMIIAIGLGWTLHSISHPSKSLHPPNRSTTINVVHMA